MNPISLLALLLVLLFLALAIGIPAALRRLSERRRRRVRRVASAGTLGTLALAVLLTVPNMIRSDAVDQLPSEDRATVRAVVRSAPGCSMLTRVAEVRPSTERPASHGFQYRCDWTVLGWPTSTGEAFCVDGHWVLPGYFEPGFSFEPCGPATGSRRP